MSRKYVQWSKAEVVELVRLHLLHGNNWRTILENSTAMRDNGRTTIDMKDKARTKGFKERVRQERCRMAGGKMEPDPMDPETPPPAPRGNPSNGFHPPPPGLAEFIASQLGQALPPPPGVGLPPPNLQPNMAPNYGSPSDLSGIIPGMPLVKMEPHENRVASLRLPDLPDFSHLMMCDSTLPPARSVMERSTERAGLDAPVFMPQSINWGGLDLNHLIPPADTYYPQPGAI